MGGASQHTHEHTTDGAPRGEGETHHHSVADTATAADIPYNRDLTAGGGDGAGIGRAIKLYVCVSQWGPHCSLRVIPVRIPTV